MLVVQGLSFAYGDEPVLADIDLRVEPGRIIALCGPSGCGKSTLLRLLAGLLRPAAGAIENSFPRVACVFQEPRLLPWRTAAENIAFGMKAFGTTGSTRRATATALLRRLRLEGAGGRYPHELSGGMRQRVALGRALAVDPGLMLLDEPFSALDVGVRRELQTLLRTLLAERGLAAVFVTHDLAEALRIGDELIVMSPAPGRVVYRGTEFNLPASAVAAALHERVAHLLLVPQVAAAFSEDDRPPAGVCRSDFAGEPAPQTEEAWIVANS